VRIKSADEEFQEQLISTDRSASSLIFDVKKTSNNENSQYKCNEADMQQNKQYAVMCELAIGWFEHRINCKYVYTS
jgi:hypothetical protein